jgi:hypothetical protein
MFRIRTYNSISDLGLARFTPGRYELGEDLSEPHAFLLRSQDLHSVAVPDSLVAVARAGAGVNNIPVELYTHRGIVVFNTPGANANAVKELVAAALFLSSRNILGGMNFVQELKGMEDAEVMAERLEREKKRFAGSEVAGKTLGVIGLGAIGAMVANMGLELGMKVAGYDPAISVESAWRLSHWVEKVDSLEALLCCRFCHVHVPVIERPPPDQPRQHCPHEKGRQAVEFRPRRDRRRSCGDCSPGCGPAGWLRNGFSGSPAAGPQRCPAAAAHRRQHPGGRRKLCGHGSGTINGFSRQRQYPQFGQFPADAHGA